MVWIRVDDHFDEHPKFAKAGPLGTALWLAGLAYCNRNQTDGFIPWAKARTLVSWEFLGRETNAQGSHQVLTVSVTSGLTGEDVDCAYVIELLLDAGLWEEAADDGYLVHDYAVYQPTKEQIASERASKVAAGQAGGVASAQARAQASAQPRAQAESNPVPGPVPGPVPVTGSAPKNEETPLTPRGGKRAKPAHDALTDRDREALTAKWSDDYGGDAGVLEEIAAALNHNARLKCTSERLYVDRWLRKELMMRPARGPTGQREDDARRWKQKMVNGKREWVDVSA